MLMENIKIYVIVRNQDENIFMYISPWFAYREVWESSKRILDVKEDDDGKIRKT